MLLGRVVYSLNFPGWGLLPKLGALPPPSQQAPAQAAVPVIAHLIYGAATAATFEALR